MLGLFFDVKPKPGHMVQLLRACGPAEPVLAGHDGLLYLERFRPLDDAEALLSHQHWTDEAALAAWRREATHRASQAAGRRVHFEDYRIRVGPAEERSGGGPGRHVVTAEAAQPLDGRGYESVTRPGRFLTLAEAETGEAAREAAERARAADADAVHVFRDCAGLHAARPGGGADKLNAARPCHWAAIAFSRMRGIPGRLTPHAESGRMDWLERVAPDRILDSHSGQPVIPYLGGRYGGERWGNRILLNYVNGLLRLSIRATRTLRRLGGCVFRSSSSTTWCGSNARPGRWRRNLRAIPGAAS